MITRFGVFCFLTLVLCFQASAQYKGAIDFNSNEKRAHKAGLPTLLANAGQCLKSVQSHQTQFYKNYGITAYYGVGSIFDQVGEAEKKRMLGQLGLPANLLSQMRQVSCVTLAAACLEMGFEAAKQEDIWGKIVVFLKNNNMDGTSLVYALQKLGWKVAYWNPDPSLNEYRDNQEKAADPANTYKYWGYHAYRYQSVMNLNKYYYNMVDDKKTLVGFRTQVPQAFVNLPYALGIAHTGYHVFSVVRGQVYEGHSGGDLKSKDMVESGTFNPLAGKSPQGYYSGLFALPPVN